MCTLLSRECRCWWNRQYENIGNRGVQRSEHVAHATTHAHGCVDGIDNIDRGVNLHGTFADVHLHAQDCHVLAEMVRALHQYRDGRVGQ
jgi:hypothetical protein